MYRLYSWEHSYFSGKVRAYLRFKQSQAALGDGYEDILATPDLIAGLLTSRSGSGANRKVGPAGIHRAGVPGFVSIPWNASPVDSGMPDHRLRGNDKDAVIALLSDSSWKPNAMKLLTVSL